MSRELPSGVVRLKRGREQPVQSHHPWIFSGAVRQVEGTPQPGDLVDVVGSKGEWLARGYYNHHSQIRVRLLTWNIDEEIDSSFWQRRLEEALGLRSSLVAREDTDAYRLVHAESDRIPGLVVDRYGPVLVLQALTAGIDLRKQMIGDLLLAACSAKVIVERSDADVRKLEGLSPERALLAGNLGDQPLWVMENGYRFQVDPWSGHKTGLYLDQRENRQLATDKRLVEGKEFLNVFSYTGGFGVYAAARGARRVIHIDSSRAALELAESNVAANCGARPQDEYILGSAFDVLREYRAREEQFDVITLDPPKFAHRRADIEAAQRGYKDLNLLALQLLRRDGYLVTFSCSGAVSDEMFQRSVVAAAHDLRRPVQFLGRLQQGIDHPVLATFPEGHYLKGFLCRAL